MKTGTKCLAPHAGVLLALLLVVPGILAGEGEVEAETRRRLAVVRRDADPAAFAEAVEALEAGSEAQRQALHALLARMADDRLQDLRDAVEAIDELTRRIGDGARAAEARRAWEDARASAVAWIFDEKAFPVPAEVVITGPKQGYPQAKARGDEAVRAYDAMTRKLGRPLSPVLRLSRRKAEALAREQLEAKERYLRVAAHLPAASRAPEADPFAAALLATRTGAFEVAIAAYVSTPSGWRRLCLYHALCEGILARNEAEDLGMARGATAAIAAINRLRISLGISPLFHHEKLVAMAGSHSKEMKELGYFSHRSPTPGRETKEDRARLVDYDAKVVECITGVGGGTSAVEFWRYDGGHHRDMCNPDVVEAGCGTEGPTVYVGGKGATGHLPGFRY